MAFLSAVTLLWAFSFSLIGVYLAGQVDPWFSALSRIVLAMLVFMPFLKVRAVSVQTATMLMLIGAIQLGLMYGFYYHSFLYLSVPEVLLFTVMTPLYVTLVNDLLDKRLRGHFLLSAAVATLGAIAIRYDGLNKDFVLGFFIVQGANLCFATGQVLYKRVAPSLAFPQHQIFGWFFIGASLVSGLSFLFFGNIQSLPATDLQWGILLYLGIIASGLGYFGWNKGATQVDVGSLAIMNNLLIPAGILVNLLIWNRDADLLRLTVGGGIILLALPLNQWLLNKRKIDANAA
ncbi:EamA family transporter [Aliiglaciecola sp. CAU 1673]|uniref:EamA family transporter n=1 Tax=Aliiglaciecola sp. CAU 1673 TaxID=3032595 RepID=UPI0023D9D9B2|nr:EamA family transporter [Aliiglaciecola sp. CAU 1673]MDF2178489.1 EamA family transporter [Aliiglaciecola sp. CAU 1673]